jgi:hypothetical protein
VKGKSIAYLNFRRSSPSSFSSGYSARYPTSLSTVSSRDKLSKLINKSLRDFTQRKKIEMDLRYIKNSKKMS